MKVYVLVFAFPHEGLEVDSIYLRYKDAEKARVAKRPQKFWEVDEMELEMPKKLVDQFNELAKKAEEEPWIGMMRRKKRSSEQ